MNYTKSTGSFLSSQGTTDIAYYMYRPVVEPKAMIQISHGMCEYIERYEGMIDYLTGNGFLVFGNDHLGHKNSVQNNNDLGFIAHKDGWKFLYRDVLTLAGMMKKEYPALKLFLFGHSMGSFVARCAVTQTPLPYQGVIICGTGGSNPALKMGRAMIAMVKAVKGERYRSPLLTKVFFGSYNKQINPARTSNDWLTRDEAVVDRYNADPFCTFQFTASGYDDLTSLLQYVSSPEWYKEVPQDLPVYLIAGEDDPVGNWSKGVKEVFDKLNQTPRKDCTMKLYPGMRHEVHNENGKEEVYQDIRDWVTNRI